MTDSPLTYEIQWVMSNGIKKYRVCLYVGGTKYQGQRVYGRIDAAVRAAELSGAVERKP